MQPQYTPREPGNGVLGAVIRDHLEELLDRVASEADGPRLPAFVVRELRAVRGCGDIVRGFARYRCDSCRRDLAVPFSCGGRVCPSCAGRRMADTACHQVDRVLSPTVRWRQYVVTFPAPIAVGLCFRARLASAVTRVCMRVLFEHQIRRAVCRLPDGSDPGVAKPAAVVWIQRFSDGLGAWLHLHALLPDGVFRQLPDSPAVPFEAQPPPTSAEVERLVRTLAARVDGLLRRHAKTAVDDPLLERCSRPPAVRVRVPTPVPSRPRRPEPLRAEHAEYTVHAATSAAPSDSAGLERLVRYMARPPLSLSRLKRLPDGRVAVVLKRPRRGVTRFVFEPLAFLARLAALIPRPKQNQTLYFGALAGGSPLRPHVIPQPPPSTPQRPTAPARPQRMSHAALLSRALLIDIAKCPCKRPTAAARTHPGSRCCPGRGRGHHHVAEGPTPSTRLTPDVST